MIEKNKLRSNLKNLDYKDFAAVLKTGSLYTSFFAMNAHLIFNSLKRIKESIFDK